MEAAHAPHLSPPSLAFLPLPFPPGLTSSFSPDTNAKELNFSSIMDIEEAGYAGGGGYEEGLFDGQQEVSFETNSKIPPF